MPSPSASLATLRPDLAGSLEEFDLEANAAGYVGLNVFPTMEVGAQSGTYGKIPIEELLVSRETRRAPGAVYSRGNWKFTTGSYATEEHGTEEAVDKRESRLYANYFDAEMVSARRARHIVVQAHELRVAAICNDTTTYSAQTTTATHEWDDDTNSVPIENVDAAAEAMYDRTGLWPNLMIMTRKTFRNVRSSDQLLNRIEQVERTLPGDINVAHLQAAFDIPRIIIANSVQNSANPGQSASIASVWDDEMAVLLRVPMMNDIREPGFGRTFHWGEDGSRIGGTVESYYQTETRSDVIRVRMETDERVIYPELIQIIDNLVT